MPRRHHELQDLEAWAATSVLLRAEPPPGLSTLRVAKTYPPGKDGAKRFARRFGGQLVCVRHRLTDDGGMRYTTVELLVEVTPVAKRGRSQIAVRIPATDQHTRRLLIACGARWQPKQRYWLMPHLLAKHLDLLQHRVPVSG